MSIICDAWNRRIRRVGQVNERIVPATRAVGSCWKFAAIIGSIVTRTFGELILRFVPKLAEEDLIKGDDNCGD